MKRIMLGIIALLLGISAGYSYNHFVESTKFRSAYWDTIPVLADCTHGTLDNDRIEDAIDYWNEYNHRVAYVDLNPSFRICSEDHIYGFIIVKNAILDWPVLGETSRRSNISRKINSALIILSIGNANEPRLLEHELGHAFGYRHMEVNGHIMHSDYDQAGYDFWEDDSDD